MLSRNLVISRKITDQLLNRLPAVLCAQLNDIWLWA
jgi:hypothetical protein